MVSPDTSSEALAQFLRYAAEVGCSMWGWEGWPRPPRPRKFDPAKPLSPLAAKLLATSNAFGEAR